MKPEVLILNFSNIYQKEQFYFSQSYQMIDCHHLSGTNCFCSEESASVIRKLIKDYSYHGIHFLDSGNYHYVSEFFIEKIKQDFVLIVFDHHIDIEPSKFGSILTCGSWILNSLQSSPYLKKVILIGNQINKYEENLKNHPNMVFIDEKQLEIQKTYEKICQIKEKLPVYISIDKDVLSPAFLSTNWDQGKMNLEELKITLTSILRNDEVLGIDICGEPTNTLSNLSCIKKNDSFNQAILSYLLSFLNQ